MDEQTLKREPAPLDIIKAHKPKYLLTMDCTPYSVPISISFEKIVIDRSGRIVYIGMVLQIAQKE